MLNAVSCPYVLRYLASDIYVEVYICRRTKAPPPPMQSRKDGPSDAIVFDSALLLGSIGSKDTDASLLHNLVTDHVAFKSSSRTSIRPRNSPEAGIDHISTIPVTPH